MPWLRTPKLPASHQSPGEASPPLPLTSVAAFAKAAGEEQAITARKPLHKAAPPPAPKTTFLGREESALGRVATGVGHGAEYVATNIVPPELIQGVRNLPGNALGAVSDVFSGSTVGLNTAGRAVALPIAEAFPGRTPRDVVFDVWKHQLYESNKEIWQNKEMVGTALASQLRHNYAQTHNARFAVHVQQGGKKRTVVTTLSGARMLAESVHKAGGRIIGAHQLPEFSPLVEGLLNTGAFIGNFFTPGGEVLDPFVGAAKELAVKPAWGAVKAGAGAALEKSPEAVRTFFQEKGGRLLDWLERSVHIGLSIRPATVEAGETYVQPASRAARAARAATQEEQAAAADLFTRGPTSRAVTKAAKAYLAHPESEAAGRLATYGLRPEDAPLVAAMDKMSAPAREQLSYLAHAYGTGDLWVEKLQKRYPELAKIFQDIEAAGPRESIGLPTPSSQIVPEQAVTRYSDIKHGGSFFGEHARRTSELPPIPETALPGSARTLLERLQKSISDPVERERVMNRIHNTKLGAHSTAALYDAADEMVRVYEEGHLPITTSFNAREAYLRVHAYKDAMKKIADEAKASGADPALFIRLAKSYKALLTSPDYVKMAGDVGDEFSKLLSGGTHSWSAHTLSKEAWEDGLKAWPELVKLPAAQQKIAVAGNRLLQQAGEAHMLPEDLKGMQAALHARLSIPARADIESSLEAVVRAVTDSPTVTENVAAHGYSAEPHGIPFPLGEPVGEITHATLKTLESNRVRVMAVKRALEEKLPGSSSLVNVESMRRAADMTIHLFDNLGKMSQDLGLIDPVAVAARKGIHVRRSYEIFRGGVEKGLDALDAKIEQIRPSSPGRAAMLERYAAGLKENASTLYNIYGTDEGMFGPIGTALSKSRSNAPRSFLAMLEPVENVVDAIRVGGPVYANNIGRATYMDTLYKMGWWHDGPTLEATERLPDNPQYGPMGGKFVTPLAKSRIDIFTRASKQTARLAGDVTEGMGEEQYQKALMGGKLQGAEKALTWVTRGVKRLFVSYNPTSRLGFFVNDFQQEMMALPKQTGMEIADHTTSALHSLMSRDWVWQKYSELSPSLRDSSAAAEYMGRTVADLEQTKGPVRAIINGVTDPLRRLQSASSKLYQFEEALGKLTIAHGLLSHLDDFAKTGVIKSVSEPWPSIVAHAERYMADYADKPPLVDALTNKYGVFPFMTYVYKMFGNTLRNLSENPSVFARVVRAKTSFEQAYGPPPEAVAKEKADMPWYFQATSPFFLRLPGLAPTYVNTLPLMPWGVLALRSTSDPETALPLTVPYEYFGPQYKTLISMLLTNQDDFKRDIVPPGTPPADRWGYQWDYLLSRAPQYRDVLSFMGKKSATTTPRNTLELLTRAYPFDLTGSAKVNLAHWKGLWRQAARHAQALSKQYGASAASHGDFQRALAYTRSLQERYEQTLKASEDVPGMDELMRKLGAPPSQLPLLKSLLLSSGNPMDEQGWGQIGASMQNLSSQGMNPSWTDIARSAWESEHGRSFPQPVQAPQPAAAPVPVQRQVRKKSPSRNSQNESTAQTALSREAAQQAVALQPLPRHK